MFRYIGSGAFLPGVPRRDLTEEEIKRSSMIDVKEILASGLYVRERKNKTSPLGSTKELKGGETSDSNTKESTDR
ncbi:MAG: hypothetical protein SVY53_05985 [Chloroflexota bacterium]|nr:hypothetical protein [Chloroflexota bacterium]